MDSVPFQTTPALHFEKIARRRMVKGLIASGLGGIFFGLSGTNTALATDFGTITWSSLVRGTVIKELLIKITTGRDDLRGPLNLVGASEVHASVILKNSRGQTILTRQLNNYDEGWPNNFVAVKRFPFEGTHVDGVSLSQFGPVAVENIVGFKLHFVPNGSGVSADNWNMNAIDVRYPKGDTLPLSNPVDWNQYHVLFQGSGLPYVHRFRENTDSEGGPEWLTASNQWNGTAGQDLWRSCIKCQSLFWSGRPSVCPAGGSHDLFGSFPYVMFVDPPPVAPDLQELWRSCIKCQSLFWSGRPSVCPAGGSHDPFGSFAYTMFVGGANPFSKQAGWRSCAKCQTLFWAGNPSVCPEGSGHDASMSWQYSMAF